MTNKLNVGIIGYGKMGRIRARAMKKDPLRQTEKALSIIEMSC